MAYHSLENWVNPQAIADTSATKLLSLGTIIRAEDPDYGVGEFIYLTGVASTVAGSWVSYNADDFTTTLLVTGAIGPVAVAMSANVASQYGWYQIQGKAIGKAGDVADDGNLYPTSNAGIVDDVVVTGDRIHNAKAASADDTTTGTIEAEIARPWVDDGLGGGST